MKILIVGMGHTKHDDKIDRARSGGETKLIMILKEWLKINSGNIFMLCPNLSRHLYEDDSLKMNYLTLSPRYDSSNFGSGVTYLKRIFGVYRMDIKEKFDVIFSASDIFFDIIPSVIQKRRNPQSKLISCLYLIAPSPFKGYRNAFNKGLSIPNIRNISFYLSQKLSIFLLKRYADSIWVLNRMDKQTLGNMNIPLDKIEVVSGGTIENNCNTFYFQKHKTIYRPSSKQCKNFYERGGVAAIKMSLTAFRKSDKVYTYASS
jgi:hypothetical protein